MKLIEVLSDIEGVIHFKSANGEPFGMFCRKDIISKDGCQVTLYYQTKHHTKDDLKRAKSAAKNAWDVVRFKTIKIEED